MKKILTILFLLSLTICNAQITYHGSGSNPADNGTVGTTTVSVTPPGSMLIGDLVYVSTHSRVTGNTHDIVDWGGQVWQTLNSQSTTNSTAQGFWCRYNGAWKTNPSFSFSTGTTTTVVMHVFRPPTTSCWWSIDIAQQTATFTAGSSPFTKTITGQTTTGDTTVTIAAWYSVDDNTWGSLSGTGWVGTGSAQYRNTNGSDNSSSFAHKLQLADAATGNVSLNQATLGGDAGQTSIITFKCTAIKRAGTVYYVSPSGNDGNAGTIGSPFRNWQKVSDVLQQGDTAYFRGGTYEPTTNMATTYIHCYWTKLAGNNVNPILIANYPGETPVYDFHGDTTTRSGGMEAVLIDYSNWVTIKGLRITGAVQISDGSGVSRGLLVVSSYRMTVEQCVVDSMGGDGFGLGHTDSMFYINNDAHHNYDPYTVPAYDGANGFAATGNETSTNSVYTGNRAWSNADDGFDFFDTDGRRILTNNWAFWNGYLNDTTTTAGNGNGFKLGPTHTDKSTDTLFLLYQNLAIKNRTDGFSQNLGQCLYKLYNNNAYRNGNYGYWWGWYNSVVQDFKNDLGFDNGVADLIDAGSNIPSTYNSWNGVVTVTNSDFTSINQSSLIGARGSDGSLPTITFMNPVTGSDLINGGSDVGYGNDIGRFQWVSTNTGGFFIFF